MKTLWYFKNRKIQVLFNLVIIWRIMMLWFFFEARRRLLILEGEEPNCMLRRCPLQESTIFSCQCCNTTNQICFEIGLWAHLERHVLFLTWRPRGEPGTWTPYFGIWNFKYMFFQIYTILYFIELCCPSYMSIGVHAPRFTPCHDLHVNNNIHISYGGHAL